MIGTTEAEKMGENSYEWEVSEVMQAKLLVKTQSI